MTRIIYPARVEPVPLLAPTADRWFVPLSDPVRRRGLGTAFVEDCWFVGAAPFAETVTADRWLLRLAEPQRGRPGLRAAQFEDSFFAGAPIAPAETVTVDRWLVAFAAPVRRRPALPAGQHEDCWLGVAGPFPEAVSVDRWLQPLAEPVRLRADLGAARNQALFYLFAPAAPAETVTADKWFVAFSAPRRTRPALPTGEHQVLAYVGAAPFAETVSADRWLQPLVEPPRGRAGLAGHLRPQPAAPVAPVASTPSVAIDSWFAALAEPIRLPRALPAEQRTDLAFVKAPPFAEAVSLDRWLLGWTVPPRLRHLSTTPHGLPPAWLVQIVDIPSGTAIPRSGGTVTSGGGSDGAAVARASGTPAVPR